MHRLRQSIAAGLLAATSCAGSRAPAIAVSATPAGPVKPGFYAVGGGAGCARELGAVAFLPEHGQSLVVAGGAVRRVALEREAEGRYAITGTGCTLAFERSDPGGLGLATRVLAHRGDTRFYPANTMPAFEAAMAQGFAGFELDVRLSREGIAIVSHDDNLAVATNCTGRIAQTDAAAIGGCRAVRTPLLPERRLLARRARVAAAVPTLGETFARFLVDPRVAQIVVDIKIVGGRERLVAALARAMPCRQTDCLAAQRRLTFISQDLEDIALLRPAFPNANIALESNATVSGLIDEPGDHWSNRDFDTFSLSFNSLFDLRLKLVKLVRGENLTPVRRFRRFYERNRVDPRPRRLLGWTINNGAGVRGLRAYRFDDVLTDLTYEQFVRKLMEDPR